VQKQVVEGNDPHGGHRHICEGDRARVITLHNPFLYSDPPLPCRPPSYWLRLFSSQTFSHINTPTFSNLVILHTYPPVKMEQTGCSETLTYKIQTPGNYPEESIQQHCWILAHCKS